MANPRGSPWLVPAVLVFVVVPIAIAVNAAVRSNAANGDSGPALSRDGSVAVGSAEGQRRLALRGSPVESYDVTYRVIRRDPVRTVQSTERVQVQRPFNARITATNGRSSAGSERLSRLGAVILPTGSGARRLDAGPAIAASDLRFDIVLSEAVADDVVEVREQRKIAGRRCQVYRFGSSVISGEIVRVNVRPGEYADVCIDENGLLLEERWVKDGKPLRERLATRVDVGVAFSDEVFRAADEQAVSGKQGNGFFREVEPSSSVEGTTWALPQPPAGFSHLGRFAVQDPRLDNEQSAVLEQVDPPTSLQQADVYQRGPDVIVVTTTIDSDPGASRSLEGGRTVDLGPLGQGRVTVDLRGNTVSGPSMGGRAVRVFGTRPSDELVALAKAVVPVEGTGLIFR